MNHETFLRRALTVDAVVSGVFALLLIFDASFLAPILNLSVGFLHSVGVVLLPMVIFIWWTARRTPLAIAAVYVVIVGNALWVVDSLLLLTTDWIHPNAMGKAFIVSQAILVGVFAECEFIGLKRARAAAAG